jgi:shikimate kinase
MTINIFMLGMPSSGKSTLGRQLAKKIGYEFLDLDYKIELAEGKKVPEIFSIHGEEYFRKIEGEQLRKIPKDSKLVIATGGGTPCYQDGMSYIKENGLSVFLDVRPEQIASRMKISKRNNRPLIDITTDTILEDIKALYERRVTIYRQADITIEGDTDADTILWILEAEFAKN